MTAVVLILISTPSFAVGPLDKLLNCLLSRRSEAQVQKDEKLTVGSRVHVFRQRTQQWESGTVEQVLKDGYDVLYDDGSGTKHYRKTDVKLVRTGATTPESVVRSAQAEAHQFVEMLKQKRITENDPRLMAAMQKLFDLDRNNLIFSSDDGPYIAVHGSVIDHPRALQLLAQLIARYPGLIESAHGSLLVHGSDSSSLLAFTRYNNFEGALIPAGILERQGKIPFGGEIIWGRGGVNQSALSTTLITAIDEAVKYSGYSQNPKDQKPGWSLQKSKETEAWARTEYQGANEGSALQHTRKNRMEVEQKRQKEWEKLSADERKLVSEPFPIVFGIRPRRLGSLKPAASDVDREVLLKDGAKRDEIRVVWVPKDKILEVKHILSNSQGPQVRVEDIGLLNRAP